MIMQYCCYHDNTSLTFPGHIARQHMYRPQSVAVPCGARETAVASATSSLIETFYNEYSQLQRGYRKISITVVWQRIMLMIDVLILVAAE